jgi:hypothetical protein
MEVKTRYSVNNRMQEDEKLLKDFAKKLNISESCFKYYPTRHDKNLFNAVQSNAHELKIRQVSEMRNDELEKLYRVSEISRIKDCMWEPT